MAAPFQVTAVIPVHNGLPDVLEAVDSVLAQSHPVEEIVLVDDGSTDGSGDAVERRFGARVRMVRGRFGSAAGARNAGWKASRSPWVAFLDADDLWFPDKLATAAACLAARPESSWFFSDGAFRTLDGELHTSWFGIYAEVDEAYCGHPIAQLFEINFILTSSVVVRRDALERTGGFDEGLSHAEDLDLWIRLSRGWAATASPRPLVRYQHRPGGLTQQVESRLSGDVTLFRRLANDATLPNPLRHAARRRETLAHYKLAVAALREGRRDEARRHLVRAWMFPARLLPLGIAWGASLLPASWFERLRSQDWAKQGVGAPFRSRRVVLNTSAATSEGKP